MLNLPLEKGKLSIAGTFQNSKILIENIQKHRIFYNNDDQFFEKSPALKWTIENNLKFYVTTNVDTVISNRDQHKQRLTQVVT